MATHGSPMGAPWAPLGALGSRGLQDKVVPPAQTQRMANALRENGIPFEVRLFEEEGHGFRNQTTQIRVLEETEVFFRHHLQLSHH